VNDQTFSTTTDNAVYSATGVEVTGTAVSSSLSATQLALTTAADTFQMDATSFSLDEGATSTSWADVAAAAVPYPVPSSWLSAVVDNDTPETGPTWLNLESNINLVDPAVPNKYAVLSTTNANTATLLTLECPLNTAPDPTNIGLATYASRSLVIDELSPARVVLKRATLTEDFLTMSNTYTAGTNNQIALRSSQSTASGLQPVFQMSSVNSVTGPTFTHSITMDGLDGLRQNRFISGSSVYGDNATFSYKRILANSQFNNTDPAASFRKYFDVGVSGVIGDAASMFLEHSNPVNNDLGRFSSNVRSTTLPAAETRLTSTKTGAGGWDNSVVTTAYNTSSGVLRTQIDLNETGSTMRLNMDGLSKPSGGNMNLSVITGNTLKLDVPAGADLEIGAGAFSSVASGGLNGNYLRIKIGGVFYKIALETDV
jgi:hypothetical protein